VGSSLLVGIAWDGKVVGGSAVDVARLDLRKRCRHVEGVGADVRKGVSRCDDCEVTLRLNMRCSKKEGV
jgi:hypothetical protein